jgi:hypothetical protein
VADRTVTVTPLWRPSGADDGQDEDDDRDDDYDLDDDYDDEFGDDFDEDYEDDEYEDGDDHARRPVVPDAARTGGAPAPIPGTDGGVVRAGARTTRGPGGGDMS